MPESLGGTELYVSALAQRLQQAGHDVLVAAPEPGAAEERRYRHAGIDVYRYPITARATRAEARGRVITRGAERFHRWLTDVAADIVHFHTFVTGLGIQEVEAARATGAQVIVTSHAASLGFLCERGTLLHHGVILCDGHVDSIKCAQCALEQRHLPVPIAWPLARTPMTMARAAARARGRAGTVLGMRALIDQNRDLQRRLFEAASAVVVLSDWAANVLRTDGAPADRVIVNRLGVDTLRGPWVRKPRRPTTLPITAGFVGRAESIKGLEDAVRAVTSLPHDARIQLRVVAAASSPLEQALVERCRTHAASDPRVRFDAALLPEDVPAFLAGLDVLLCPSRAVEGGPTVALEAHAVGTPVIGAAMPALTEYVEPGVNGALFPPGDWAQLARLLDQIARDPGGTIDRWQDAIRPPRTFDEIARDYQALYARILGSSDAQWTCASA